MSKRRYLKVGIRVISFIDRLLPLFLVMLGVDQIGLWRPYDLNEQIWLFVNWDPIRSYCCRQMTITFIFLRLTTLIEIFFDYGYLVVLSKFRTYFWHPTLWPSVLILQYKRHVCSEVKIGKNKVNHFTL